MNVAFAGAKWIAENIARTARGKRPLNLIPAGRR